MLAEVQGIAKRIEIEVPPSGVLYYKYKNPAEVVEIKSKQIANK